MTLLPISLLLSLLAFTGAPPEAVPVLTESGASAGLRTGGAVTLTVTGARNNEGRVVAMLFASSDGFPTDRRKAAYSASARLSGGRATIRIPDVRAGLYSIVVFHDADGNGAIKRNLIGMPTEGIGVTRFDGSRPTFRTTAVEVPAAGAQFTIPLNYR